MYRRLMIERPKLSELGFYLVISGTLFLVCQNVLEESAALNSSPRNYSNATEIDILLELLATLTLPFGLAMTPGLLVEAQFCADGSDFCLVSKWSFCSSL